MKNKIKYHTVATIPKSNIKIVERGKIITPKTIRIIDGRVYKRFIIFIFYLTDST
jgi:hypothetical protein